MNTPIYLKFLGLLRKVTFTPYEDSSWKGLAISFPPIPAIDEFDIFLCRRPFVNSVGKRFPLSDEDACQWGTNDDWDCPLIYTAYIGSKASRKHYCVKIAMHTSELADRTGNCQEAIDRMVADARFHAEELQPIEGTLVPTHYGLWRSKTTWGGEMLCAVMEHVGVPWNMVRNTPHDTPKTRLTIARAVENLHEFKVEHNQLLCQDDMHHVMLLPTSDGDVSCFIVDFSQASRHLCARIFPMLPLDDSFVKSVGCREANSVMFLLGMFHKKANADVKSSTRRALKFFNAYTTRFPDLDDDLVLIAQRHHCFDDSPLSEDIKFGFRDNGSMVQWFADDEFGASDERACLLPKLSDTFMESLSI